MRHGTFINIAIDGPTASGKGTVAKGLGIKIGIPTLDTGAIYRGVTVFLLDYDIDINDEKKVLLSLAKIDMRVFIAEGKTKVFISGRDISGRIRDNEVSRKTAVVAAYFGVRDFVNAKIAEITKQGNFIVEGRDIGTAVLPDAQYKFFLTAAVEKRAERRMKELRQKDEDITLVDVMIQLKERDDADMRRAAAPLKQAPDAILIDCTDMTIDETIAAMAKYIKL
jgi:cytidylate kinase